MSELLRERPRRRRSTLSVLSMIAGALMLLGGSTYALWTDAATVAGDPVSTGRLDIAPAGAAAQWDVSADLETLADTTPVTGIPGRAVDGSTAPMIPGDTREVVYLFEATLEGDNILAELSAELANPAALPAGLSLTVEAFTTADGSNWESLGAASALGADSLSATLGTVRSSDGSGVGGATARALAALGGANVAVVVTVVFDAATTGQVSVDSVVELSAVSVALQQVRSGAGFSTP